MNRDESCKERLRAVQREKSGTWSGLRLKVKGPGGGPGKICSYGDERGKKTLRIRNYFLCTCTNVSCTEFEQVLHVFHT